MPKLQIIYLEYCCFNY